MICTVCNAEVSSWRVVAGQPQCMRCSEGTPTLEEQVATLTAERDDLKVELQHVLDDWNGLVKAIGSPTNGAAAAYAQRVVAERDAARAEVAALRDVAEDFLLVLKDDGAECTCEPGDTCPLCRCTEALAHAPASAQRLVEAVKRADAKDRAIATLRAALDRANAFAAIVNDMPGFAIDEGRPVRTLALTDHADAAMIVKATRQALVETAWTEAPGCEVCRASGRAACGDACRAKEPAP